LTSGADRKARFALFAVVADSWGMDVSQEDAARPSPVPLPPPAQAAPSPADAGLEREQTNARLAAEQLGTDYRARLDRLSRRQEWAIACCGYLDKAELEPALVPILDDLRTSGAGLAGEYDQALRAAARSLPAGELDGAVGRFRDICDARQANLDSDSQRLPELIELRGVIERGHAERAGGGAAPDGQAAALGVLEGLIVMASRLGGARMAVGLAGPMVAAALALAGAWPAGEEDRPAATGPVPAPGDRLGRARAGPGGALTQSDSPRCVCLDTGNQHGAGQHGPGRPLIYLVDTQETDQGADDALASCGTAVAGRAEAWFASGQDGARPAVGLVVWGPVPRAGAGPRGLDAGGLDAGDLAAFARSAIFHATYDGSPRTAAVAMHAARALEAVALVDAGTSGGAWVDVNPARQQVAATFVIEDCGRDRMSFSPS
jgi:hypothetical protein